MKDIAGLYITGVDLQDNQLCLTLSRKDMASCALKHKVVIHTANFNYMQLCGTAIQSVCESEQEIRINLSDGTAMVESKSEPFEVTVNGGTSAPFFRKLPELIRGRIVTNVLARNEPPSLNLISAPDLDMGFFDLPYMVLPAGSSASDLEGLEIVRFHIDESANQIIVSFKAGITLVVDSSKLDDYPESFEVNLTPKGQKPLLFMGR